MRVQKFHSNYFYRFIENSEAWLVIMSYTREKKDEAENIVAELSKVIDVEKFNRMLLQEGVRKNTLQGFIYKYVCYHPPYNPHIFDDLTMDEWQMFAGIIDFSECPTLLKYRELMNKIMKNFPALRDEDVSGIYDNITSALKKTNEEYPIVINGHHVMIPYLNWTPFYGGIISPQLTKSAKYRNWAINNMVCYYAEPDRLVMNRKAEQEYDAGYDDASQQVERNAAEENNENYE